MAEKETKQTKELADIIVEKFRTLVALESKILESEGGRQSTVCHLTTAQSHAVPKKTPPSSVGIC